jgi:branched-chain amino acid transport system ATP-binding protein
MAETLLAVRDLHAYYGTSYVLQGITLEVKRECVAVLGRNGAGKTTLLRAILGLKPPTCKGSIFFHTSEILAMEPYQIAVRGVGYVPQGRRLFSSLSVDEHLRLLYRKSNGDSLWDPGAVYDLFPALEKRRNISGTRLSGGEQQMLAIGRALVTNPSLLLMDEPSEGLSPLLVQQLTEVCRKLADSGIALLLVEQKLRITDDIADRVYVMVTGRVVHEASGKGFAADQESRRQYLGV